MDDLFWQPISYEENENEGRRTEFLIDSDMTHQIQCGRSRDGLRQRQGKIRQNTKAKDKENKKHKDKDKEKYDRTQKMTVIWHTGSRVGEAETAAPVLRQRNIRQNTIAKDKEKYNESQKGKTQ